MDGPRVLLARVFIVRPGEGGTIGLVALLFALAEAGRALGEIGIDTLVSLRLGPQHYPSLFVVLGAVSLAASLVYGAALGRLPLRPLLIGMILGIAGLLLAGWTTLRAVGDAFVPALWVATFTASMLILTMIWTVAGAVFDARQARRLFSILAGAAIAGSLLGNLSAGPLARLFGTDSLILAEALFLVAAAAVLARTPVRPLRLEYPGLPSSSVLGDLRAGFDFVAGSPLMRLVALSYVLFSVLSFSVTFPYFTAMSQAFPQEAAFATANGLVQTAATATSLLLSVLVAARLYARFGVAAGGLLLPIVYLAGFGVWIVSFGAATAILVRWLQLSTQRGLSNAAWTAMYNVVPAYQRARVLAFNDGVPGQLGIILSGLLLLAAQRFLGLAQIFWLGAATAAICAGIVLAIRRRYAGSLLAALRSGLAEQVLTGGGEPVALDGGPALVRALRIAMQDPDPAVRRLAVAMLGRIGTPAARRTVASGVEDPAAEVRTGVVAALVPGGPKSETWPVVVGRLGDDSASVRAVAAAGLARHGDPRGPGVIAELLGGQREADVVAGLQSAAAVPEAAQEGQVRTLVRSPSPAIRVAALRALDASSPEDPTAHVTDYLAALVDESAAVRGVAAEALCRLPGAQPAILQLLRRGGSGAQVAVVSALPDPTGALRTEVATWAQDQIARGRALQSAAAALPDDPADELLEFLRDTVERSINQCQEHAVLAAANLGSAHTAGVLRRSLRAGDPDVRAQAVEALDSVLERRLGRALAALLEPVRAESTASPNEALDRLARDSDGWIAQLAGECARSRGAGWSRPEGVALPMPQTSVADLEKMIALRRVPLFHDLDPEDLHRLASVAQNRWFPPGAALMREGEVGDELVVVVEGAVRVFLTGDG